MQLYITSICIFYRKNQSMSITADCDALWSKAKWVQANGYVAPVSGCHDIHPFMSHDYYFQEVFRPLRLLATKYLLGCPVEDRQLLKICHLLKAFLSITYAACRQTCQLSLWHTVQANSVFTVCTVHFQVKLHYSAQHNLKQVMSQCHCNMSKLIPSCVWISLITKQCQGYKCDRSKS